MHTGSKSKSSRWLTPPGVSRLPNYLACCFMAGLVLFFSACGGFAAPVSARPAGGGLTGMAAVPSEKQVSAGVSDLSRGPREKQSVNPDVPGSADLTAGAQPRIESSPPSAEAAPTQQPVKLSSPVVAQRFYQIAYELANPVRKEKAPSSNWADSENITTQKAEQAIVFLSAALNLDSNPDLLGLAMPLLIKLICRGSDLSADHSETVSRLLVAYVSLRPARADREVVNGAVRYLLDRLDSREQRQRLLEDMLKNLGNKNVIIGSELATQLGLLMAEKPDLEGAQFYLVQAYDKNQHDKVAFAKLAQLVPDKFSPAIYLEYLRFVLRENPSDIQAAFGLAQYADRMELYDVAAQGYGYCANLFAYLYPSETLPSDIYLPLAISCYNTPMNRQKCLQIAEAVRRTGRSDLLLEAVAGKAASKIGDSAQAALIFQDALDKAQSAAVRPSAKEFAWFYCFAIPDPAKALDWANKAYSTEPNSSVTAAILAYALVLNDQTEWAKPLINVSERNQIADLALAKIQLKEGQKDLAIRTLESSIAKDPGSLAAEQAKEILAQQGEKYIPPVDPVAVVGALEKTFGQAIVPAYVPPDKLISVQFKAPGDKFSYGDNFDVTVAIVNNSSEPLVISDDGLFKGNIRVDADVTGDLNLSIPNLVSTRIRTTLLVEPGGSLLIPLQLVTGQLGHLLLAHPQASLDIVFTFYIDPVVTGDGRIANRLVNVMPAKLSVKRPGLEITGRYLRTRFNAISTGRVAQKIKTAQLFVGLLMEQSAITSWRMSGRKPPYKFMYADWMPALLKSALTHESGLLRNRADDEWEVKVSTMADMLYLPLDQDVAGAVAENLNSPNWPVRLEAIYLLAKSSPGKFKQVLDWAAKYDSNALVRNMAIALGGTVLKQPEQPEQLQLPPSGRPAVEESPAEPLK